MELNRLYKKIVILLLCVVVGNGSVLLSIGCRDITNPTNPGEVQRLESELQEVLQDFWVISDKNLTSEEKPASENSIPNFWVGETTTNELQVQYCDVNADNTTCEANETDDRLVVGGIVGGSKAMAEIFLRVRNIENDAAAWFTLIAKTESSSNSVFIGILPEHVITDVVVGRTKIFDYTRDESCFLTQEDYSNLVCLKAGGSDGTPVIDNGEIVVPLLPSDVCEQGSFGEGDSGSSLWGGETTIIAAVGDSLTAGWGASPGNNYPSVLEASLLAASYNVVVNNYGVNGQMTSETLAGFQSAIDGADIVLLMIGTNNVANCDPMDFCNASADIEAMLEMAFAANVLPLVSTIPPIRSDCANTDEVPMLNAQIANIATSEGGTLVNNYAAILNNGGDALFIDCLHFDDPGYAIIADQWYNALVAIP